jgi:hypothetical protein
VLLCVFIRVGVFFHTQPVAFPDSIEYIKLSASLKSADLSPFYRRTPGYPFFLAVIFTIFQSNQFLAVIGVQMFLSIFVSVLTFFIVRRITGGTLTVPFIAALVVALDLYLVGYDTALLTESLSTTLLVIGTWLLFVALDKKSLKLSLAAGGVFAFLGLTRPIFALLFFVIAVVGVIWAYLNRKPLDVAFDRFQHCLTAFFLVSLIVISSWVIRNTIAYGSFGISTSLGCNLTNLTGNFIEVAPAESKEEKILKQTYLAKREQNKGNHVMVIWLILPELYEKHNLTEPQVAHLAKRLSIRAILRRPGQYLVNVTTSWCGFWAGRLFDYFSRQAVLYMYGQPLLGKVFVFYEQTLLGPRFVKKYLPVFFLASLLFLLCRLKGRGSPSLVVAVLGMTVLYTAVLSSFVEMGENPRYRTPVEPYILTIIVLAIAELITLIKARLTKKTAE